MSDDDLDELLSNFELPPSEEIAFLDKAIEISKDIQNDLNESLLQIKRLSGLTSKNYDYNLTPSMQLSEGCAKAEFEMFSLYDAQLSSQLSEKSVASSKLSLNSSTSEDQTSGDAEKSTATSMFGYRTRKDFNQTYNRAMTEKIKCEREIEAALMSLKKAMNLSTERAREAKNYNWFKERPRKARKNKKLNVRKSASMCRITVLKKIAIKRPLSTSVIG